MAQPQAGTRVPGELQCRVNCPASSSPAAVRRGWAAATRGSAIGGRAAADRPCDRPARRPVRTARDQRQRRSGAVRRVRAAGAARQPAGLSRPARRGPCRARLGRRTWRRSHRHRRRRYAVLSARPRGAASRRRQALGPRPRRQPGCGGQALATPDLRALAGGASRRPQGGAGRRAAEDRPLDRAPRRRNRASSPPSPSIPSSTSTRPRTSPRPRGSRP